MFTLIKLSSPGWEKDFQDKDEFINELRSHICGSCREGQGTYLDENGKEQFIEDMPVDVYFDGQFFECRDIGTLLSTACGCEYTAEINGEPYYEHWL